MSAPSYADRVISLARTIGEEATAELAAGGREVVLTLSAKALRRGGRGRVHLLADCSEAGGGGTQILRELAEVVGLARRHQLNLQGCASCGHLYALPGSLRGWERLERVLELSEELGWRASGVRSAQRAVRRQPAASPWAREALIGLVQVGERYTQMLADLREIAPLAAEVVEVRARRTTRRAAAAAGVLEEVLGAAPARVTEARLLGARLLMGASTRRGVRGVLSEQPELEAPLRVLAEHTGQQAAEASLEEIVAILARGGELGRGEAAARRRCAGRASQASQPVRMGAVREMCEVVGRVCEDRGNRALASEAVLVSCTEAASVLGLPGVLRSQRLPGRGGRHGAVLPAELARWWAEEVASARGWGGGWDLPGGGWSLPGGGWTRPSVQVLGVLVAGEGVESPAVWALVLTAWELSLDALLGAARGEASVIGAQAIEAARDCLA